MTTEQQSKRKVSLSLDADLVAEFERDGPLSASVNRVLQAEQERRRHLASLDELLVELAGKYGPLDTPEDVEAIQRYIDLLS